MFFLFHFIFLKFAVFDSGVPLPLASCRGGPLQDAATPPSEGRREQAVHSVGQASAARASASASMHAYATATCPGGWWRRTRLLSRCLPRQSQQGRDRQRGRVQPLSGSQQRGGKEKNTTRSAKKKDCMYTFLVNYFEGILSETYSTFTNKKKIGTPSNFPSTIQSAELSTCANFEF